MIKKIINQLYQINKTSQRKEDYYPLLKELVEIIPDIKETKHTDEMTLSLENQLIETEKRLEEINEKSIYQKISFYLDYMFWSMWETLRNDGMGHVHSLGMERMSIMSVEINLNADIHKKDTESKEEYAQRKELHINDLISKGYELTTIKGINSLYFKDCDTVKEKYIEYLSQYCSPKYIKWESHRGKINKVKFNLIPDKFLFKKTIVNVNTNSKFNQATKEQIEKKLIEINDALSSIEMLSDDMNLICQNLISYYTFDICNLCGYEDNKVISYNQNIKNKGKNAKEIYEKQKEVGEQYDLALIISSIKSVRDDVEGFIRKKYNLDILESTLNNSFSLKLSFSHADWEPDFNENAAQEMYDLNNFDSFIEARILNTPNNLNVLLDIASQLNGTLNNLEIRNGNSYFYIQSFEITGIDLGNLIEQMLKTA